MTANRLLAGFAFWGLVYTAGYPSLLLADESVLSFPTDHSIGIITESRTKHRDASTLTLNSTVDSVRQARGPVSVSSDNFVSLEFSYEFPRDLSFLLASPSTLDSIVITGAKLRRSQLRQITQIKSIAKLEFSRCEFAADAFDELATMPELLSLHISSGNGLVEHDAALAAWIAKLPKLQSLAIQPPLNSAALTVIGAHPTLTTTLVHLDGNTKEPLRALTRLPELRNVTLIVGEGTSGDEMEALGGLSRIKQLTCFYGRIDGHALRSISKHDRLETLMLFQVQPGDDFLPSIESLTKLSHLILVWRTENRCLSVT